MSPSRPAFTLPRVLRAASSFLVLSSKKMLRASLLCTAAHLHLLAGAAAVAAPTLEQRLAAAASPLEQLSLLLERTLPSRLAPTVDVAATTVRGAAAAAGAPYTPTVLMHGLGDAGSNAGMKSLRPLS